MSLEISREKLSPAHQALLKKLEFDGLLCHENLLEIGYQLPIDPKRLNLLASQIYQLNQHLPEDKQIVRKCYGSVKSQLYPVYKFESDLPKE
ncbi:MAG: hypothetical protein WAV40_00890 [Microgenomates group bacterium]